MASAARWQGEEVELKNVKIDVRQGEPLILKNAKVH
jgi:hypothetical protein